jgi:putative zinc finger/helix-turn-helix YgiT family protein
MKKRRFPQRCGECHQKTVVLATVPYDVQIDHDGTKYSVHVDELRVPRCSNCGELSIDDEASAQIDVAFRKEAKLLSPDEIREGRINAGFPQQQEFAQCLGIGVSTLSRWETGAQIQQHFHDGILRAFFANPDLRAFLARHHGLAAPSATPLCSG